jgi:hypothetical protein
VTDSEDHLSFLSVWTWLARNILPGLVLGLLLAAACQCNAGIPQDKKAHALAGAVIYAGTYTLARSLDAKHPRLIALGTVLAAGIVKEVLDRRDPLRHTCDPLDAAATLGGGVVVSYVWRW